MRETGSSTFGRNREPRVQWLHDVSEGGIVRCRIGRQGRRFVAEWPHLARLTCLPSGDAARLRPMAGASARSVAKLEGLARAMIGDLRGGLGIHASAVAIRRRAVLLMGPSGAGKSTTSAELCMQHGARLLADDAALLEERGGVVRVVPTEDWHYLDDHSAAALGVRLPEGRTSRGKAPLPSSRPGSRACRLAVVVVLRFDDTLTTVVSRRITGVEAAATLLGSMFRFDMTERRAELDRIDSLYRQAQFIELARPRSLPSVAARIAAALGERGGI